MTQLFLFEVFKSNHPFYKPLILYSVAEAHLSLKYRFLLGFKYRYTYHIEDFASEWGSDAENVCGHVTR